MAPLQGARVNDLTKWLPRVWALLILLAVAQVIRAVVDGIRMLQALRIHGWGG